MNLVKHSLSAWLLVGAFPVSGASEGYLPVWQAKPPAITDLALIYQGGGQRPQWTLDRFAPYITYREPRSGREKWLFDGFLFIEYQNARHRIFEPIPNRQAAEKEDWLALLEKNFSQNDGVPNLEAACQAASSRIGPPLRRRQLILTLPEPIAGQTNWGELQGHALDFRNSTNRLQAIEWYLDAALQKWKNFDAKQLDLAGFYWVSESFPRTNDFLLAVAEKVHARGKRFFWIPYWHGSPEKSKQGNWRALGFDASWQQPNHFFHPEVPDTRLDDACAFAKVHGMGLEMECDDRMLDKPKDFEPRFDVYLDAFNRNGVQKTASIAYYEGGGTLFRLANSNEPRMRAHYDRIAQFIVERQIIADQQSRGQDREGK